MSSTKPPRVLQIYIDEPGGGRANVALLQEALASDVQWHELRLDVGDTRGGSLFLRPLRHRISRVVDEVDPDIIHSHGTRAALAVARSKLDRASVVTLHGIHGVRRASRLQRPFAMWFERMVLSKMDLVLCTGLSDLRLVEKLGLDHHIEIRWIHSAFTRPPERDRSEARRSFGLPAAGKVILWMGRFESEKDPLVFIDAVDRMRRPLGTAILMAGNGSLYQRCLELVRRKGLSQAVRMPGWCRDPASAYSASDTFVSTSRWEGFPLTGLEAASAGLSLVVSEVPGNVDLVEIGLEATLVPPGDASGIAAGMQQALEAERPALRRTNDVLAEFSLRVQREEVMSAYRDVLVRRPT